MYAMFTPAGISAANKRDHEVTVFNFVVTFDSLPKEHVEWLLLTLKTKRIPALLTIIT